MIMNIPPLMSASSGKNKVIALLMPKEWTQKPES